jgi:DNA-binding beta-propeller fold protein YncE
VASGSPVAIDGRSGHIFVSRFDGTSVSVLDAATGRALRTVRLRPHRYSLQTALAAFALVVDERTNRIFAGDSLGGAMSVLDAASGRLLRTTRLPMSDNPSAPLVDVRTGRVFVVDGAGVAMFDAASGRLLHTVAVPSRPGMSPALELSVDEHSGRVFAVDMEDGMVRVLDGWSGRVLRTTRLGTALDDMAVDSRRGRLIVTIPGDDNRAAASTAPGRVVVLDERTGAFLQTIMMAPAPVSVAVDEATGHVVVLTDGGQAPIPDRWSWLPPWLRRRLPLLPPRPSAVRTLPPSVSVLDITR